MSSERQQRFGVGDHDEPPRARHRVRTGRGDPGALDTAIELLAHSEGKGVPGQRAEAQTHLAVEVAREPAFARELEAVRGLIALLRCRSRGERYEEGPAGLHGATRVLLDAAPDHRDVVRGHRIEREVAQAPQLKGDFLAMLAHRRRPADPAGQIGSVLTVEGQRLADVVDLRHLRRAQRQPPVGVGDAGRDRIKQLTQRRAHHDRGLSGHVGGEHAGERRDWKVAERSHQARA